MATVDDYIGRKCPHCGAVDSLEIDDARAEVACTNCAKIVAMGLEESLATRYDENNTHEDVDKHAGHERDGGVHDDYATGKSMGRVGQDTGISRSAAAALAAGVLGGNVNSTGEAARVAQYANVRLHPRMYQYIDNLCRLARRGDVVHERAMNLAKQYVGRRRERQERVEHQSEIAAICVMLACEMARQPLPLAELHVLDSSLKRIPELRAHLVAYLQMQDEEAELQKSFADNLLYHYIRLLKLPMNRFQLATSSLLKVLRSISKRVDDLARLSETDLVVAAVLLAYTNKQLQWNDKPLQSASSEPPLSTTYTSFAANAHLSPQRIQKIMQIAQHHIGIIADAFTKEMSIVNAPASGCANEDVNGIETSPHVKRARVE